MIMQVGLGFWSSKTLLSAVELGLFTTLAKGPMTADEIRERLTLHPRSTRDFLDALVALGFLEREGDRYSNTPDTETFLDRDKPTYLGGILEMANSRLYGFWGSLTEALKSGERQNESKGGEDLFGTLYSNPDLLESFLKGMSGISLGPSMALAAKFPWAEYKSFIDIGTAQGAVPVQIASAHPHLQGGGFDLPPVKPVFEKFVAQHGLSDRVSFHGGDFFTEPLPSADVLIMGHILHDWNLDEKRMLLEKAYQALPEGGSLVVYDSIIDDERRTNAFGLLMSLNMLIETPGGFDYTGADCCGWMKDAGFREARVEHLVGPVSMVVGRK
jgi:precorrin-6B methylase 2